MKKSRNRTGVTLLEAAIVVALIVILLSTVITVATRIDNRSKEQLTESTISIIRAALEQFDDYRCRYYGVYERYDFPLDCNDFDEQSVIAALENALGWGTGSVEIDPPGINDPNWSGCEVMYFLLNRVQQCRKA